MKKNIIITLSVILFATVFIFFTTNKSGKPILKHSDTAQVLIMYATKTAFVHDLGYRIIKDTIGYSKVDDQTLKLQPIKDTLYYVFKADTVKDSRGYIVMDSLHKPKLMSNWYLWDKNLIILDGGDVSAALRKFNAPKK